MLFEMPKFLLVQRHSFCAVHVTRRWVQSAECANRGIQCVHLLCYLVTFSPQQFKYVHVFLSGRGLYRRSGKCALVVSFFPRLTSYHLPVTLSRSTAILECPDHQLGLAENCYEIAHVGLG